MNDKNIGLGNEKSLNQLIAHHGVIFKPKDGLMWVSANPFQCGKMVCYDINKIFKECSNLAEAKEICEPERTIPEDPFLKTQAYQNFLAFKGLKHIFNLSLSSWCY